MREIQELIENELSRQPVLVLANLVRRKLSSQNVTISEKTSEKIATQIANGQPIGRVLAWPFWKPLRIEFTEADLAVLDAEMKRILEGGVETMLTSVTDSIAEDVLTKSRKIYEHELELENRDRKAFERRLLERWGDGLASLRLFLAVSREFGSAFATEVWPSLRSDKPYLADVLFRSQARACQIGEAIVVLLTHGFADDAMARWRGIHEIAATLSLLTEHGEELAERYFLHQFVDKKRSVNDYDACVRDWGHEPLSEEERKRIEEDYDAVVDRFGKSFKSQFGWAADHLGIEQPTFRHIEAAAGRAVWRATYKMASRGVHAPASAVYDQLSVMAGSKTALAGPSNAGLADPAHATVLAITSVNMSLFPFFQTADSMVFAKVMSRLEDEVGDKFLAAHKKLQTDEEHYRSLRPRLNNYILKAAIDEQLREDRACGKQTRFWQKGRLQHGKSMVIVGHVVRVGKEED